MSFLACTRVELWDLTVCIVVNGEKFIFIYYNVIKFNLSISKPFELSCKKTHTQKHIHMHGRTQRL